ncbi:HEPN domain-containing protein [Nannocystis pusilla]|uniref:HEPN domain-containing protein n=1 Tax=Nannocystis pusilla TaxID=889268 RepID=A0A9X3F734_9BACT|nr:HEPN domain-containing protein [Nannocystis pusilla]MCY1012711.1 HEPN domain-containing protein [Nannocystis pusilla]
MSVESRIAGFLRVAHEDLAGARLLAAANNRNAIYLCEQSAEKLIKAILTSEGIHVGIKHELDVLVDKLPDENPIKSSLRDIEYLGAYATSYRYPTDDGKVRRVRREHRVSDAIAAVEAVLVAVAARFEVDLEHPDAPARHSRPIR